jgi:hypothetical protein
MLPRRSALEQLVPAQPLLAIFLAAQTGSPNGHLLPVHHAVTVFFPPAMSATLGVLLMTLSGQVPNFFPMAKVVGLLQEGVGHLLREAALALMNLVMEEPTSPGKQSPDARTGLFIFLLTPAPPRRRLRSNPLPKVGVSYVSPTTS